MQSAIVVVVVDQRTKMWMKKICRRAKNRESRRRRQRQSGAAENTVAGLTARRCDVGLTLRHRSRVINFLCFRTPVADSLIS